MHIRFIVLIVALFNFNSSYSFVTVGAVGCDETNIIDALNSGDSEIRLVKGNYTTNFTINTTMEIIGGYASCAAANANTPPTDKTFIFASNTMGPSVIKINLNNTFVQFSNLYITGARKDASVFNGGHGIEVVGTSGMVTIENSSVVDNRSDKGGGVFVSSNNASHAKYINISDSVIFGNNAIGFSAGNGFGGGIYCSGSNTFVYIYGETEVSNNYAENGGGIAAEHGCQVRVSSGIDVSSSSTKRGVMNNNALINGGGVYLNDNANFFLDPTFTGEFGVYASSTKPATLAFNTAGLNGGGIYAKLNSRVSIKDSLIHANSAIDGGGVYLTIGSYMETSFSRLGCWSPGSCMVISDNTATSTTPIGHGGAVYISNPGIGSSFSRTLFYGNRADSGTVMFLQGLPGVNDFYVTVSGSTLYNNGDDGNGSFADYNVFQVTNNSNLQINYSTIVDNDINDITAVIRNSNSKVKLIHSIIHNNENVIKEFSALETQTSCLVVNENTSVSGGNIYVEDPGFVNPNVNDYHLNSDSFAIDLCEYSGLGNLYDFDSELRGLDIFSVMNIEGTYDAGADEYNDHLAIFKSGFEY